ncbi:MAG: Wzy polymerase domain-containing protein [Rhodoferax sp.]
MLLAKTGWLCWIGREAYKGFSGVTDSERMQVLGVIFLVALPWLNPFAYGPSPAVVPLVVALACLGLLLVRGANRGAVFARAIMVAAVLSAMAGVYQYFGWEAALAPWVSPAQLGLAYGNLRQRNQFATLMGIGLVCVLYLVHMRGGGKSDPRCVGMGGLRAWWVPCMGGALVAIGAALSTSRTGLVQWLVMALCMEWAAWRGVWQGGRALVWVLRWSVLWYLATLWWAPKMLAAIAPVSGVVMLERLQSPVDCSSRLVLWSNVWELVLQKPWWGWGWGELDYAHFSTLFSSERFCGLVDNAHNLPLQLAVEGGLVVAVLVCAGLGWWVWREQPWKERDPDRLLAWAVLGVIGIHSMLEFPLWYGPFQLAVFWCIWVLWRRKDGRGSPVPGTGPHRRSDWVRMPLAGGLLALALVLAWDYARVSQVYRLPAERWTWLGVPQRALFFQDYLDFAQFTTTPVQEDNAAKMVELGQRMLHFSPEPRVVVILLRAAQVARREDVPQWLLPRFAVAYPNEYVAWRARQAP